MKLEEQFVDYLKKLSPDIIKGDAKAVRAFNESVFSPVIRQPRNTVFEYHQGLIAQVFAEAKASVADKVKSQKQDKHLLFKKGPNYQEWQYSIFL